jgi:intracellular sulfur oxidation DsrE/DsrF family protein
MMKTSLLPNLLQRRHAWRLDILKKNSAMKKLLLVLMLLASAPGFAQDKKPMPATIAMEPAHKVVIQLATGDTVVHKQLMKQLNNVLTGLPGSKVEVICHGPGLQMLMTEKTLVAEGVKKFAQKGVTFNACEFSMKDKNIDRSELLSDAGTVPYAIVELVKRQEQGWSYIKAGY